MASSDSEVDLDKVLDAAHRIAQYIKKDAHNDLFNS